MTATEKTAKVGTTVHFVLNHGPNAGAHRPAVVVGVKSAYRVDLQVFSDGTKGTEPKGDCLPNVFWRPETVQDETGHSEGTWHFPEDYE